MFDWEAMEQAEYSRQAQVSFVKLTERSYLTTSGTAPKRTADPTFLAKAEAVVKLAKIISAGATAGIVIPGFKAYRPYPVQAVWHDDEFKIWLKQPLFISEAIYEQALKQIELSQPVDFEQLAEGTESQIITNGPVTQVMIAELQQTVTKAGYQLAAPGRHRELYLDGLPLTNDKQVLVRIALNVAGQQPPLSAMN
ncbi:hypothetical protein [Loigolactobacillus zhaoyuanensis]|uniref:GyrI-like small molecule binding domain-containing protein n=1 Tax=Loigolactobacillus zhaoyuanensis TaxID=2486017 RepID=A0ABW8UEU9_9LACO|nr:hypothetical protein [Loigolactobacillus zhaoyuanensis]